MVLAMVLASLAAGCREGPSPSPSAPGSGVAGRVTAGPTCPVEVPGDPACVPRVVAGAVLVVRDAAGNEAGRTASDGVGAYRLTLPPGAYVLEPQPVEGLLGTPAALPFTVSEGGETQLDVEYDTGIR